MRNEQLIRQWTILRGLADGTIGIENMEHLAKVLDVSIKTIQRDLIGLKAAGFIERYDLPTRNREMLLNHVMLPVYRPLSTAAIATIKSIDGPLIDLTRCNGCAHRFKTLENGRIDMRDFRGHKATCQSS